MSKFPQSPAADAADRLVDAPVARGGRTAPAPPTSPLLTAPAPQRRPQQRTRQSLELHPARAPAFAPNRNFAKRIARKRKWTPAAAGAAAAAGGTLLARAEIPEEDG